MSDDPTPDDLRGLFDFGKGVTSHSQAEISAAFAAILELWRNIRASRATLAEAVGIMAAFILVSSAGQQGGAS